MTWREGVKKVIAATGPGREWLRRRQESRWGEAHGSADPFVVFKSHYERNYWSDPESVSGPGSTLAATRVLREGLPRMLDELGTRRLFDAPCGDFNWIRHLNLTEMNHDGPLGGFRLLSLECPPFSLPPPAAHLDDGVEGAMKKLGLWNRHEVRGALGRHDSSPLAG